MNIFRGIAEGSHVVAILVILFKLFFTKSSAGGVSWKSLFLYTATYCARYLDLFSFFYSYYNSGMKIFLLITTFSPLIVIPLFLRDSYQKKYDTFWIELLILPAIALAFIVRDGSTVLDICWTWSIYMEAVAMIPQIYMTWRGGFVDQYILSYLTGMLIYKGVYILNWIYRYCDDALYDFDWIAVGGGITGTVIGTVGLHLVSVIYRNRRLSSKLQLPGSPGYSPVQPTSKIFTLPFVVASSNSGFEKSVTVKDYKPQGTESDTQCLLRMLEPDDTQQGPYNSNLSVPISHSAFIA